MPGITGIVDKVQGVLGRRGSDSSSDSRPSSPGTKEGKERHKKLAQSLEATVDNSAKSDAAGTADTGSIQHTAIAPAKTVSKHGWFQSFFTEKELEDLFAYEHMGSYVINRATGQKFFEDMPIYARIGMHLLFNRSKLSSTLMGEKRVDKLLIEQSLKQGKIFDRVDPAVVQPHIKSFIQTYEIDTSQLLQPDVNSYTTFNSFFARKLKPDARPIASPQDLSIITSAADCRLTVWNNVSTATKIWVKGKHFSIPELLGDAKLSEAKFGTNPSLAIFRLAPADYHRFHRPCGGVFGKPVTHGGQYYTVNPQAVNTELDVFTANRRDVRILESDLPSVSGLTTPVAVVAIGALLVGSVNWTDATESSKVSKGDDIGWFQYGGSTVIVVFPADRVKWDDDLVAASEGGIEVLVRVGEKIGQAITTA